MGKAGLLGPDTTCCTRRDVNFAIIEGARKANGMETKVGTLTAVSKPTSSCFAPATASRDSVNLRYWSDALRIIGANRRGSL